MNNSADSSKLCPVCKQGQVTPVVFSGANPVYVCDACDALWLAEDLAGEVLELKPFLAALRQHRAKQ